MPKEPKKTCFAIMPFDSRFDDISQIIAAAAKECGLDYIRGDHRNQPGSIMPQILHDIRHAAVIVADVTDHNPNVFYELGIAHQTKGPAQVVLITQSTEKSPYDVNEFRQHRYDHTKEGRVKLLEKLPACLNAALQSQGDTEVWSIVRGPVQRTKLIVRDLRRLMARKAGPDLKGVVIRMASGLGTMAISHREPPDPELGSEYNVALLEERNALRDALAGGATLKAMLHPPRRFTISMGEERHDLRYQRLIGLLEGRSDIAGKVGRARDLKAIARCEFLLTSVPMPHLFIIDRQVAYEGIKRGGRRGYALTHCETDPDAIQALITDFDKHFAECRALQGVAKGQSGDVLNQLKALYQEAMNGAAPGSTVRA